MRHLSRRRVLPLAASVLLLVAACGGVLDSPRADIVLGVSVEPVDDAVRHNRHVSVEAGSTVTFSVTSNVNVYEVHEWSVTLGQLSGAVGNTVQYTAPLDVGIDNIVAEAEVGSASWSPRIVATPVLSINITPAEDPDGETITWTGDAGDGAWVTAGNWDLLRVPAPNDSVIIPAGSGLVVFGLDDEEPDSVTVQSLELSGSTLRIAATGARRLVVTGAVEAGGASARIELIGGTLIVGADSSVSTLAGVRLGHEEDLGGLGGIVYSAYVIDPEGDAEATPSLQVGSLDGHLQFHDVDVTLIQGGRWVMGTGFGYPTPISGAAGSLTVGPGAELEMVRGAGGDLYIGGGSEHLLRVAGRLFTTVDDGELRLDIPVEITEAGEIEVPQLAFTGGLESRGALSVLNMVRFFAGAGPAGYDLTASSTTQAGTFRTSVALTISGDLTADDLQAQGGSAATLTLTDAGRVSVTNLSASSSTPVVVHVPNALGAPTISAVRFQPATLILHGPQQLVVNEVFANNATIRAASPGATLATGSADLRTLVIDAATIAVSGIGQLQTSVGITGLGQARLRVEEGGTLRFLATEVGPGAGAGGALAFDHLGAVQAWSGDSELTACITTGPNASILPANAPLASLTLTDTCP